MTSEADSGHDPGETDAPPKARRLVLAFVMGFGLAGAALVALFALREAVVEAVVANRLGALGLDGVELAVEEVALRRTRIAGVTIGRDGDLRIERIDVTYDPRELVRGKVRRVEIKGLRLNARVDSEGISLGSLDALLAPGDGTAEPLRIPPIRLQDGRIEATTPAGPVTIAIDGMVDGSDGGAIETDLRIAIESPYGDATGTLEATRNAQGITTANYAIGRGELRLPGARIDGLAGGIELVLGSAGHLESASVHLEVPNTSLGEVELGAAEIRVEFDHGRAALDAKLKDAEKRFAATVRATIDDVFTASRATIAADGRVSAQSVLWQLLDIPAPSSGDATVAFTSAGAIPSLATLAGDPSSGLDLLTTNGIAGNLALRIEDVAYTDVVSGLDAKLDMDVSFGAEGIAVTLPTKGLIDIGRVKRKFLRTAGIPRNAVDGLEGPLSIELGGTEDFPFRLAFRPEQAASGMDISGTAVLRLADGGTVGGEANGTLNLEAGDAAPLFDLPRFALRLSHVSLMGHRVAKARASGRLSGSAPDDLEGAVNLSIAVPRYATDEMQLADIRLETPAQFRLVDDRIVLWIGESGTLEVGQIAVDKRLRIDKPLRLSFQGQTSPVLEMALGSRDRISFKHYFKFRADEIAARVLRDGEDPISITLHPLTLRLNGQRAARGRYRIGIELSGDGFALPDFDVAAGEIGANLVLGASGDGSVGRFGVRDVHQTGDTPAIVPLQVTGTLERRGKDLIFAVQGVDPAGIRRIVVTGSHAPESSAGQARIEFSTVTFASDGLQPAALFPGLADLREVGGSAAASARLHWDADGFNGDGEVSVDDLSFTQSDTSVEGLTAAIRFDSLVPPSTPPGQTISARRIDPAIPLTDVALDFQIEAGGAGAQGRIRVEHAEAGFAGGRIELDDTVIEPGAPRHDATFAMSGLDLEQMLRIIDVDGLGGSGKLSGNIPVAVTADDNVIVENGVLTAEGKGVIRYRSEQAEKALAGGGESVDLMLRALQNFHYEELSVTVDKGVVGEARIGLRMLGQNPDVLDGHPFKFNINLTGNLDKVLAVVLEGYRASNRLLGRTLLNQ